jgi:hypothetical protein
MMDVQAAVFAFDPVRIISKAVYSHALESRIFGKPFLRPIVFDRACLAPRLPGTAAEAVHEYEVDKRLGGRVKEVESKGASRIIHAIVRDGGGLAEATRA